MMHPDAPPSAVGNTSIREPNKIPPRISIRYEARLFEPLQIKGRRWPVVFSVVLLFIDPAPWHFVRPN